MKVKCLKPLKHDLFTLVRDHEYEVLNGDLDTEEIEIVIHRDGDFTQSTILPSYLFGRSSMDGLHIKAQNIIDELSEIKQLLKTISMRI